MARILLGVTGSVAATRTPELFGALRDAGHDVRIVATAASLYFFDPVGVAAPGETRAERDPLLVIRDEDEWPGHEQGLRYQRGDEVLHIELRRWAELFLIAPLDANTLAKLAGGLCDNCLTCVWRAWDLSRPVVLAPAMNTLMWEHPLTRQHLRQVAATFPGLMPPELPTATLLPWINQWKPGLKIVAPIEKQLACGDLGMGAMAEIETIVRAVN